MKKIVYIDLDGVMVDLVEHAIERHGPNAIHNLSELCDEDKELFENPKPISGALDAFILLLEHFDVYFLSTAPWENTESLGSKRRWIEKHLGKLAYKKLILSHRKDLLIGDYLIDDRSNNGAKDFKGEWIHFGQQKFENWDKVLKYLIK
jgi:5'(3')-deoxyribonucleotidase